MPKGEHFKKPNPRINQVSFKVNDIELEKLNELVSRLNTSVPEWIRSQIHQSYEALPKIKPEVAPENNDGEIENQMSLF